MSPTNFLDILVLVSTGLSAIFALWWKLRKAGVLNLVVSFRGGLSKLSSPLLTIAFDSVLVALLALAITAVHSLIVNYAASLQLGAAALRFTTDVVWITNGLFALTGLSVILPQLLHLFTGRDEAKRKTEERK